MNCKVCGTRLGILERWRYGDFCSEDHKIVFADDLENLNRQLSPDPTPAIRLGMARNEGAARPGAKQAKDTGETTAEAKAEPQTVSEPHPVMADFLQQTDARPQRPVRLEEKKAAKPAADRSEKTSELWRLMAKRAEQESIPVAARTSGWQQDRPMIVITSPQEFMQGPGGYYLGAAYPAMAPAGQMLAHNVHLPQGGLTGVRENFWGPSFAVGTPFVPAQPKHWVDDQGWHWISDASAQMFPSVENVLAAYPMAAPWAQWPLMAPGMAGQQRVPTGQTIGAGAMPQMASGPAGSPAGQMPGGMRPGGPSQSGTMPGGLTQSGMMPGGPAYGGPGPGVVSGVSGGVFGGGQVLGWGTSYPTTTGPMPLGGPGYQWRELPPPFFSALVDLSHGVQPLAGRIGVAEPPISTQAWPELVPTCPNPGWTLEAELSEGTAERVQTRLCSWAIAEAANFAEAAAWTAIPVVFTASPGLPQPRIPRRVAPPIVLPLGNRLGLSRPAEPMMSTGTGFKGGRGA